MIFLITRLDAIFFILFIGSNEYLMFRDMEVHNKLCVERSIFVAVVFDGESFHIFEGDFAFVVAIEDAVVAGDVGGGGVEFFVHGAVEIHKHFTCGDGFEDSVFVVVIHVE